MLALNVFTKLAKAIKSKNSLTQSQLSKASKKLEESASTLLKVIEEECEKDKQMSNLKGKIKEIKAIIQA